MTINSDARLIAFHYFDKTKSKTTKAIMTKTIGQAKSLLTDGYTVEEITNVIDYIIDVKKINMYSLGYVNYSINNILREIVKSKEIQYKQKLADETNKQIASTNESSRNEVKIDDKSTNRNKNKLERFGVQPRFGEEFNFDMFEE